MQGRRGCGQPLRMMIRDASSVTLEAGPLIFLPHSTRHGDLDAPYTMYVICHPTKEANDAYDCQMWRESA